MPLPRNVRPNPYQGMANQLPGDVVAADVLSSHQGINPRAYTGHPGYDARAALYSSDIAYGQAPVRRGMQDKAWEAAREARKAEISQQLTLNGLGKALYSRPSGTFTRQYTVKGLGSISLPSSAINPGPPHFRGLGFKARVDYSKTDPRLSDLDSTDDDAPPPTSCTVDDSLALAFFAYHAMREARGDTTNDIYTDANAIFGEAEVACAVGKAWGMAQSRPSYCSAPGTKGAGDCVGMSAFGVDDEDGFKRAVSRAELVDTLGGWKKDGWKFLWWLTGGASPYYFTPWVLGVVAAGGGYYYYSRKGKKGRRKRK